MDAEPNPNLKFKPELAFVYTKLLAVAMEDMYDKVVYLDSDTLVLENVDELFECGPFCAVMRDSELLNSGVLVIDTSEELFQDMKALMGKLGSYTGG